MTETVNDITDQMLILILNKREEYDHVYSRLRDMNNAAGARMLIRNTVRKFSLTKELSDWCKDQVLYTNNLATVLYEYLYEPDDSELYKDLTRVERERKETEPTLYEFNNEQPKRKEKHPMSHTNIPKFETKNLVNGQDVNEFKDDELIYMIDQCNKNIERLESMKIESKAVTKKVEDLRKAVKKLIEVLDSRV